MISYAVAVHEYIFFIIETFRIKKDHSIKIYFNSSAIISNLFSMCYRRNETALLIN